ncbi:hypothetical protein HYPSUDRAFT_215809 [Hypholoma sublateritium FD-334 SS-4]|uniref:Uncharacterized protein n=1 Tax=Hypholoma sublateritium (strain FD-334 SS-4) TaxID=945553 RepID=A0A0D2PRE1_HYPSF|nr:hypothetical protein HYPSUDRAFT_215809 [Hypholoma sublateritium FD-334 SS-4]
MQGQSAEESQGRGAFTSALLSLIEREGVDQLTYEDIIMSLPVLSNQNPQCEGVNRRRILFNSRPGNHHRKHYTIRPSANRPGEYILSAGDAHGITERSKFDVYSNMKMSSPPLGSVWAIEVSEFSTRCSSLDGKPFSLLPSAYAAQTHSGIGYNVRIFIETTDPHHELFISLLKGMKTNHGRSYHLAHDINDKPDLAIQVRDSGHVQFNIMDELCREYGLTRMPFDSVPVDNSAHLVSIFCGAADFYRSLHHSRRIGLSGLSENIEIECLRLVPSGEYTDDLDLILVPEPGGQNLNVDGKILIDVDKKDEYGYRIKNNSTLPLYAALFYFDMSDLSISSYYLPGTALAGNADFSVLPQGSISIGFGDSGTVPRIYSVKASQNIDVGYLKLYLSTQFIDYSHVAQQSPFLPDRGYRPLELRPLNKDSWDTLTIPIIQRKGELAEK